MLLYVGMVAVVTTMCAGFLMVLPGSRYESQFPYLVSGKISVDNNTATFAARPATFGPMPPAADSEQKLEGEMHFVHGSACHEDGYAVNGKVAVVLRGDCSFYTKVKNLQHEGALAVVIGNNEPGGLISMGSNLPGSDIVVPSMFVTGDTYRQLQNYHSAQLELCPETVSLLSSLVLFVLTPLLSITIVYVILSVQRYHERVRRRAPKHAVEALPVRTWSECDVPPWGDPECVICLDAFDKSSRIMTLPCGHEYHEGCVRQWLLQQRRTCPICTRPITSSAV